MTFHSLSSNQLLILQRYYLRKSKTARATNRRNETETETPRARRTNETKPINIKFSASDSAYQLPQCVPKKRANRQGLDIFKTSHRLTGFGSHFDAWSLISANFYFNFNVKFQHFHAKINFKLSEYQQFWNFLLVFLCCFVLKMRFGSLSTPGSTTGRFKVLNECIFRQFGT